MTAKNDRQDLQKRDAAMAAIELIKPLLDRTSVVGVGTGSTTNHFIDGLAGIRQSFDACVSSSESSAERLRGHGISVIDLNAAPQISVYVDGADEIDRHNNLIKGGGGALTREKIVAASADHFICIVDASKCVDILGRYPLPVEVIPMARGLVARALVGLGGEPVLRADFTTDNGNQILDVHGLDIVDPVALEAAINNIVGVVCNGVFSAQRPQQVLIAGPKGVEQRG